jgi:predicted NBD/HSP70 family sugar kinase
MPGARAEVLTAELAASRPADFDQLATRFARALGNAIELYDPGTVVLYGTPFRQDELLRAVIDRVESNERPCEIRRSLLDPELPALGGVALALDRLLLGGGAREPAT